MVYVPNGKVIRVESISGPAMLVDSVLRQVSTWTVKTDARGEELCVSLIIADFRILTEDVMLAEPPKGLPPSAIRVTIEALKMEPMPATVRN